MVIYKKYTTDQYEKFFSTHISENWGISESKIADWFMAQAGAQPVIRTYGVTKDWLLTKGIPLMKQYLEGGFVFFLAYTVSEGGGAGNWINHYAYDTPGAEASLRKDLEKLRDTMQRRISVAWSAPEVAGYPTGEEVPRGNAFYAKVPFNTIGACKMPLTMAGNVWVYAPKWCEARQSARAPGVYFGNSYDKLIQAVIDCGGKPFDGATSGASSTPSASAGTSSENNSSSGFDILSALADAFNSVIKAMEEQFNKQMYDLTTFNDHFTNDNIQFVKTFNNTGKIEVNPEWMKSLEKTFNDVLNKAKEAGEKKTDTATTPAQAPETGSKPSDELGPKVQSALNQIAGLNGRRVGDGQCYALTGYYSWLIDGLDISYSNGHTMRRLTGRTHPELGYPFSSNGYSASKIAQDWDWSGWTIKYAPISANDLAQGAIYNVKSNFGGVFWTGGAGHTGVISIVGNEVQTIEQNYGGSLSTAIRQYNKAQFASGLESIIYPPKK